MGKVLTQLKQNCRNRSRHKITSVLYTEVYTDGHTDTRTDTQVDTRILPKTFVLRAFNYCGLKYRECYMRVSKSPIVSGA